MFDLDISKMIIVGIVALAVIPPKDLPRVMRTVGQTIGKMRRMATEFQGQFMEAMREVEREADLDSVKKEFQAISDQLRPRRHDARRHDEGRFDLCEYSRRRRC
jgi:sec-independent protein translocase protein TatB